MNRSYARLAALSRLLARNRAWMGSAGCALALALWVTLPGYAQTSGCDQRFQCDATDFGGPVMPAPGIVLLFWLPSGEHFDQSGSTGDLKYESLMKRFFTDVSPSSYYNILSEYPGACSINTPPPASCFGPITSVTTFIDNNPYPHLGNQTSPVTDIDIHAELIEEIANNHWPTGIGTEYFVFLGRNIQECNDNFNMCTFPKPGADGAFCAYHGDFLDSDNNTVLYSVMPAIGAIGGCNDDINTSPNGLVSADREIMATSHEFFESMSDPLAGGDVTQVGWTSDLSGEIGDTCNQLWGHVEPDGRNVTLNGNPYVVQEIWSNNADNCVLSAINLAGITLESKITTGNDDLRDNTFAGGVATTADGSSQGLFAKHGVPGWATQSTHVRVDSYTLPITSPLTEEDISLTSHPAALQTNDVWQIQTLDVKLRSANGTVLCEQTGEAKPLVSLTDNVMFKFPTNCTPASPGPEAVECFVFDDGYANIEGPSNAIFISGRSTNNEMGKACIPGSQFGHCHKWFGKCRTVTTHIPVNFQVFDDGYSSMVGPGDSILIPSGGNEACTPVGCRRWFGLATAGGRSVTCSVFNDGGSDIAGPSDAIYIPQPIPGPGMACIPGLPSPAGVCRRWFGQCTTN